jgi:hypothetical protein
MRVKYVFYMHEASDREIDESLGRPKQYGKGGGIKKAVFTLKFQDGGWFEFVTNNNGNGLFKYDMSVQYVGTEFSVRGLDKGTIRKNFRTLMEKDKRFQRLAERHGDTIAFSRKEAIA